MKASYEKNVVLLKKRKPRIIESEANTNHQQVS